MISYGSVLILFRDWCEWLYLKWRYALNVFEVSLMVVITFVVDKTVKKKMSEHSPYLVYLPWLDRPSSLSSLTVAVRGSLNFRPYLPVIKILLNNLTTSGLSCYTKSVWIPWFTSLVCCARLQDRTFSCSFLFEVNEEFERCFYRMSVIRSLGPYPVTGSNLEKRRLQSEIFLPSQVSKPAKVAPADQYQQKKTEYIIEQ